MKGETEMSFVRAIGAFAIGAAVGAIGSYIYLKRKFEKELDERVSAIKNTMDKMREAEEKEREESNSSLEKLKAEAAVFHEGDVEETEEDRKVREEFIKKLHDENYDYDYDYDLEEPVEMDEHGDPIDKDNEDYTERYMDIISGYDGSEDVYLITEDDFNNNIYGHEQKIYLFFDKSPDGKVHVMEEDGDEIQEDRWQDELGYRIWANEDLFDYYPTHDIYIRNEQITTDFLIHRSELEWIPSE